MMDELKRDVMLLVSDEVDRAYDLHGQLKSDAEAFGVIAEEIQQLSEQASVFIPPYGFCTDHLLKVIRRGQDDEIADTLEKIRTTAINTACEAIQVAAVAIRFCDMLNGGRS